MVLFEQGQTAQERGDFQTAIRLYGEVITLFPHFYQVYYQRGSAFSAPASRLWLKSI